MAISGHDMFLLDCPTYDDYLDTYITRNDMRYVRNVRFCRLLVQLGYRSSADIYTPKQFEEHKAALIESLWPTKKSSICYSTYMKSKDPVLLELAAREQLNTQKVVSTIIFIKYRLKNGFEVSGYLDFEHSLRRANQRKERATDWAGIFAERKVLKPKPNHLSYFDWHKGIVRYNNSDNFLVVHDAQYGLIFMHRGDHKMVCVDVTKELYSKNCQRSMHFSEKYGHVIFYDHVIRKKI